MAVFVGGGLSTSKAFPSEPNSQEIQELDPVIVTGSPVDHDPSQPPRSQTASSVLVVPPQDIQQSRGYNFDDVFQFSPGVFSQSRGGASDSRLSIRGTNLSSNFNHWGVNLLINGLPMNTADGFATFEAIDLLAVEHIEVYKGAHALRFGSSTLGGAVNFVVRSGADAAPLQAKASIGSFGFYSAQLSSGQVSAPFTLGSQRAVADYYISATASGQHGYRTNSQQDALRLLTNVGLQMGEKHELRLILINTSIANDLPGPLTKAELEKNPRQPGNAPDVTINPLACLAHEPCRQAQYTQLHWVGLRYDHQMLADHRFTLSPFYQYWIHDISVAQKLYIVNQDVGAELRYTGTGTLGRMPGLVVVGFSPRLGESQTQVWINNFGNRGARLQNRFTQTLNLGSYVEGTLDPIADLSVVAGGRMVQMRREGSVTAFGPTGMAASFARGDRTYSALLPKLGLVYRVTPTSQVFGNVSRGYEPPINIQLIQLLDVNAVPPEHAFIDLDAQRAWQFELGYRGTAQHGKIRWDLTLYDLEMRKAHLLTELTIPGVGEVPTFRNAKRTRHTGVEVGGAAVVGEHLLEGPEAVQPDRLTLRMAYTWSRYRFLDDLDKVSGGVTVIDAKKGNAIPGVPEHWVNGELRYDHPSGFWLAPNVQWSPKGYFTDFRNTTKNSPFFIVNLKGGWQLGTQWQVYLEGRNLTDQNYAGSVLAGGGNSSDRMPLRTFFPSWPRSVFGGIEFQWN